VYYTSAPVETFKSFLEEAKKSLIYARNCLDKLPPLKDEGDTIVDHVRELEKIAKSIRAVLEEERN
jgi:hypothetical protein